MGGSYGTPKPEKTPAMLQAYAKYLPSVLQATAGEIGNLSQKQLDATRATDPGYQALNLAETEAFGPGLAKVGSDIQRQNALEGARTNVMQLNGPGGEAAKAADAVNRATNPNYYKVQDAASEQAKNLINSVNLNGLSPGEANAIERSTNQANTATGNLGLNNPTNTIANAMNFGGAYNAKLGILSNALQTGTGVAQSAQNNGFNPVNIALGQPNTTTGSNFGTNTFAPANAGTNAGSTQGALGFGQGLLSNQFGQNTASIGAAASRANANSIPAYMGAAPSYS